MAKFESERAVWEKPALVRTDQTLAAVMACNCAVLVSLPVPVA